MGAELHQWRHRSNWRLLHLPKLLTLSLSVFLFSTYYLLFIVMLLHIFLFSTCYAFGWNLAWISERDYLLATTCFTGLLTNYLTNWWMRILWEFLFPFFFLNTYSFCETLDQGVVMLAYIKSHMDLTGLMD